MSKTLKANLNDSLDQLDMLLAIMTQPDLDIEEFLNGVQVTIRDISFKIFAVQEALFPDGQANQAGETPKLEPASVFSVARLAKKPMENLLKEMASVKNDENLDIERIYNDLSPVSGVIQCLSLALEGINSKISEHARA